MSEQVEGVSNSNQEVWKPAASFYESDPRSKNVRETCIPALSAIDQLLFDEKVKQDSNLRSNLYSQLQDVSRRLVELGVLPNMHVGKPYEFFKSSPVAASEFLAGQLSNILGRAIPSESVEMKVIEEFSDRDLFGGKLIGEGTPERSYKYMALLGTLTFIKDNFDIQKDQDKAQDKNSLAGKILRTTDDGKPAPGNPFGNLVYSYGHRNPQGISWDENGKLYENEHGPSGVWPNCCQDEINEISKGGNYGWPESVGDKVLSGTISPLLHSKGDTWAPSGNVIVGDSLFFAGLRGQALYEYKIPEKKLIEHFKNQFGRLREVILGSDGMLYVTTSNRDGRGSPRADDDLIMRVNPSKL